MHIWIVIREKLLGNKISHNLSMLLTTKYSFMAGVSYQTQHENNETPNLTTDSASITISASVEYPVEYVTVRIGSF